MISLSGNDVLNPHVKSDIPLANPIVGLKLAITHWFCMNLALEMPGVMESAKTIDVV